MRKNGIKWLFGELPKLIEDGILSPETARSLRTYYGKEVEDEGHNLSVVLIGILGGLLIGIGIISLFAFNWNEISRPVRAGLALSLLVISQCLVVWTLLKRPASAAWREGTSLFLSLMVGASIALVSQTYNIPGSMETFLFSWMLLFFPVIYLLDVTAPVLLFFAILLGYVGNLWRDPLKPIYFWGLFLLMVPQIIRTYRKGRTSVASCFLTWAVCLALPIGLPIILDHGIPGMWLIILPSLFSIFSLLGSLYWRDASGFFRNGYQIVGSIGVYVTALAMTWEGSWWRVGWNHIPNYVPSLGPFRSLDTDVVAAAILLVCQSFLFFLAGRGLRNRGLLAALLPIVSVVLFLIVSGWGEEAVPVCQIVLNLFVFALGILQLMEGISERSILRLNLGMAMVVILIAARFFDSEVSFILKGVTFIAIGIGFLYANFRMTRARGSS